MFPQKPDDAWRVVPRSEALLWTLFIPFATATQLAFKWAGSDLEGQEFGLGFVGAALGKPSVWTAIVGYVTMFMLWINILRRVPLSRAFVMTAIVYVPVTIGAWLIFDEQISALRGIGIAAIMMGVVLINSGTSDRELS
jgi:drug/metabolite transporter (DMT)-like permease